MGQTEKPKKKLKKWQIVIIVIAVLAVIGAIGGGESGTSDSNADTTAVTKEKDNAKKEPTELVVVYNGSLDEGTSVNGDSDFDVSIKYSDGSTESTDDWTLTPDATLIANTESVFTITSGNLKKEISLTGQKVLTMGQKNALAKADDYLNYTAFSYSGLIEQLEYEGFSTEEATFAADNCGADWNEQAAKKAQDYLDYTSFSRQGLIDQLIYEGFTQEQAEYGVTAVGY